MSDELSCTSRIQAYLDRLRNGDESAKESLIALSYERLYRLAHKLIKSYPSVRRWEETQDVVQEASLRLYRVLAEIKPDSVAGFMGLAAAQIRRQLIDFARHYMGAHGIGSHHKTSPAVVSSETSEATGFGFPTAGTSGPATLAEWTEFHVLVDRLPPDERQVFDLHYYSGLSHAETARLLGVSEKTVKRRWQAARIMLGEMMLGEPPP